MSDRRRWDFDYVARDYARRFGVRPDSVKVRPTANGGLIVSGPHGQPYHHTFNGLYYPPELLDRAWRGFGHTANDF